MTSTVTARRQAPFISPSLAPGNADGGGPAGLLVRGLYKSYDRIVALDGVDLDVPRGQVTALLGPNGSGKTTLLSAIAGLVHAEGEITLDGVDVLASAHRIQRCLSLAPQELGLYAVLSVADNLHFYGTLAGLSKKQLRKRVDDLANALDLTSLLTRPVQHLSAGEKRRVHTATALLGRPALLLLDEPTAGVDVANRSALLGAVRAVAEGGSAVCYSTHYLAEAAELKASVTILHRGAVIASGPVAQLVADYGQAVIDLSFEGPAPETDVPFRTCRNDNTLRVFTPDPSAAATVLAALGHDVQRLRSITMSGPSLETVFLTLTGQQFAQEDPGDQPDA